MCFTAMCLLTGWTFLVVSGFYIARRVSFNTLGEMVAHYQADSDGLCTQLGEPARKDDMPQTQGLAKDQVYSRACRG